MSMCPTFKENIFRSKTGKEMSEVMFLVAEAHTSEGPVPGAKAFPSLTPAQTLFSRTVTGGQGRHPCSRSLTHISYMLGAV